MERLEIANLYDGSIESVEDPGCGIFVYAGVVPNTELYTELMLQDGYIPTNEKMETAIPGVYAAGDIRVKQVRHCGYCRIRWCNCCHQCGDVIAAECKARFISDFELCYPSFYIISPHHTCKTPGNIELFPGVLHFTVSSPKR